MTVRWRLCIVLTASLLLAVSAQASSLEHSSRWDRNGYSPQQLAANGKRWEEMTPREREEVRQGKAQYDALPDAEKRRLRHARDQYKKMPPEQRRQVRERWDKMSAEDKRRYQREKNYYRR